DTPIGVPVYLVTRYEDVRRVLADADTFSSARTLGGPGDPGTATHRRDGVLVMYDPPQHTPPPRPPRRGVPAPPPRPPAPRWGRGWSGRWPPPGAPGSGRGRPPTWWRCSRCPCRRW